MLEIQRVRRWAHIVTLDESWFYLSTDHEMTWLQSDEKVPKRERHTIQSTKLMLVIVWNPCGYHVITVLPNGCKFNASHSVTNILGPLADWRTVQARESNRKLIIHTENARPHVATMTQQFCGAKRNEEHSSSRLFTRSCTVGLLSLRLRQATFNRTRISPWGGTSRSDQCDFGGIEKVTLERVFLEWMERLRRWIDTGGEYAD
jgi:hypothetical protein